MATQIFRSTNLVKPSFSLVSQWCCNSVIVVLCCNGVTIMLQWCYNGDELGETLIQPGDTVALQLCHSGVITTYSGVTVVLQLCQNGVKSCYNGITIM
jgi:sulfur transfer complex TusBCD TusB component (DsrH family)